MNSDILFESIGEIKDGYILSAYRRMETQKRKPVKKLVVLMAAVLVLMMAAFTTGMALNADFREFVFDVLHISQPEQVPDFGAANTQSPVTIEKPLVSESEKIDIGGVIEGRYIHAPMGGAARNGVFLVCTDEVEMNSGSHYDAYIEQDGEFVKLEEYTFSHDYTILGNDFHVEFEWVKFDTGVAYTYIDPEAAFRTYNFGGTSEAVLVYFKCLVPNGEGLLNEMNYPALLNFETGEITDILAGTGAESLENMYSFALSEDRSGLLICCWDWSDNEELYYADLVNKRLLSLTELSGEKPDECCLTGDTIVCWLRDDISLGGGSGMETVRAWAIDLNTLERRDIFSGIPVSEYALENERHLSFEDLSGREYPVGKIRGESADLGLAFIDGFDHMNHSSNMYAGSCFAVGVDREKNIYVIDLVTGDKTQISGLTLPEDAMFMDLVPSPDGKKLLIHSTDDPNYSQHIGVINMETFSYVQFDRLNENVSDQVTVYWYDNEQIIICGETKTENGQRHKDYYIYALK